MDNDTSPKTKPNSVSSVCCQDLKHISYCIRVLSQYSNILQRNIHKSSFSSYLTPPEMINPISKTTDASGHILHVVNKIKCIFELDSSLETIRNWDPLSTYPPYLFYEIPSPDSQISTQFLEDLTSKGKFSRARGRYPWPVILFRNKFICRAGAPTARTEPSLFYSERQDDSILVSLSSRDDWSLEPTKILSRQVESFPPPIQPSVNFFIKAYSAYHPWEVPETSDENESPSQSEDISINNPSFPTEHKALITSDQQLLKLFNVNYISNLMLQNRRLVWNRLITSSEKGLEETSLPYSAFAALSSIPCPGTKFFSKCWPLRPETTLEFDWDKFVEDDLNLNEPCQDFLSPALNSFHHSISCDFALSQPFESWAQLEVPFLQPLKFPSWTKFQQLSISQITSIVVLSYIRCLLHPKVNGLLIHCLSGWDRTPYFISLLRISLWADGEIHQSLSPDQILYLLLGYDWFLFLHRFYDRASRNEHVLGYLFDFLPILAHARFSVHNKSFSSLTGSQYSPSKLKSRTQKLSQLYSIAQHVFDSKLLNSPPLQTQNSETTTTKVFAT